MNNNGFFQQQAEMKIVPPSTAIPFLTTLLKRPRPITIAFDYETTGLRPFRRGHKIVSLAVTICEASYPTCAFPLGKTEIALWKKILRDETIRKVAHNLKFEHLWGLFYLGTKTEGWVWDTMVMARILDNQVRHTSLEEQAAIHLKVPRYKDDTESMMNTSKEEKIGFGSNAFNNLRTLGANQLLLERNALDAYYTCLLYEMQQKKFTFQAAYDLFQEGLIALADIEQAGIRVDVAYFQGIINELDKKIACCVKNIWRMRKIAIYWKTKYGKKLNFNSSQQQAHILFSFLKQPIIKRTPTGLPCTDDACLQEIDHPLAAKILEMRKIDKVKGTYITSLLREQTGGFIHPCYNLHTVTSYRGSCNNPSFQNIPVHDIVYGPMIRKGILPRDNDHQLGEVDYNGIEVRIATCYHKDPAMLAYIKDQSKDLHRDMTCRCFKLTPEQVTKPIRFIGKNSFVFPQFYGSYWAKIAPAMWKAAAKETLADGTPLLEHLHAQGITTLGIIKQDKRDFFYPTTDDCFYAHIREVEIWFWTKKFKTYASWRKHWFEQYLKKGEFNTLTGFCCRGDMRRTEVINLPVQGSAFHCLLWAIVQIHRWLEENNMNTRIVGQIHDSIVFDIYPPELPALKKKVREVMCVDIRKHWSWIIVPLDIELELSPVGKSWNDKKKEII